MCSKYICLMRNIDYLRAPHVGGSRTDVKAVSAIPESVRPRRRNLGNSGIMVAPLALAGNVFGWTASEEESFRILDAFVAAGYKLIDTADTYSIWETGHMGGESETIIGNWLQDSGRRDEVVLATNAGMDMGSRGRGLSAAHVAVSVEASLRRLQTDHIDLYQSHIDDPTTRLEETLEAFSELARAGSVRAIGASNYSEPRLRRALRCSEERGFRRFESLQPRYNLIDDPSTRAGWRNSVARSTLVCWPTLPWPRASSRGSTVPGPTSARALGGSAPSRG
jgi:aryl-alcohol dehydrogenase-like predicted oxidoreductase